jgi:hypothetical protein
MNISRGERRVAAVLRIHPTDSVTITVEEGTTRDVVWISAYQEHPNDMRVYVPISFHIPIEEFRELCAELANFAREVEPELLPF